MTLPKRLYKYRSFSDRSLGNLIEDKLYFADPSTFNDPLDTKPGLEIDLPDHQLETVLTRLVEQRVNGEMEAAAKAIRYKGPKTRDHIVRQSRKQAEQIISDLRYHATNPEVIVDDPLSILLGQAIERELLRRYDGGIVALAKRYNCPLMWSHYGDQHRGIAIGFSIPAQAKKQVFEVKYGGSSMVQASLVRAMLNGDDASRRAVDQAVLLKKAWDWRYEKEWRLIGRRGEQDAPIELEEIVFGLRCPSSVIYSVVKALEPRERPVKLYEIRRKPDTFLLERYKVDTDELAVGLPRRALSIAEAFDDLE